MSYRKSQEASWKSCLKRTESANPRLYSSSAYSKVEPLQRRSLTETSRHTSQDGSSSSVKWKHNTALSTTRTPTFYEQPHRIKYRSSSTNPLHQQQRSQYSTYVTYPHANRKMALPESQRSKGVCSCPPPSLLRNEVLRRSLMQYAPSTACQSRTRFTSLPEHVYRGSKLPIPNIPLGRKLPAAPEMERTFITRTHWIRKAESEKRPKISYKSSREKYPGTSKIPQPIRETPRRRSSDMTSSLHRLLTAENQNQFSGASVPLDAEIPLSELSMMDQKLSQLRCVLATLQGTVNAMEKSYKESYCTDECYKESTSTSKNNMESNFESMGRVFKTVNNTLSQLNDLNGRALGLYVTKTKPLNEKTFLVSEESKEEAIKRTTDSMMEDSEIFGKGFNILKTALEITLSKDKDATVEDVRNQIVDTQIDLLDDAVMSPAMPITDQLVRSEQVTNKVIKEVEEFVHSKQLFNPTQTIDEVIEEVEKTQFHIKTHEVIMDVLSEALQENSLPDISCISTEQILKQNRKKSRLTAPIVEEIYNQEGNISVFELELSLQEATSILDVVDPCPSVTGASYLNDILLSRLLKNTVIHTSFEECPNQTVREVKNNLKMIQDVFDNAELHPESTNIKELMKPDILSENPLIGTILRKEMSDNPEQTVLDLVSKISDVVDALEEGVTPHTTISQLQKWTNEVECKEDEDLEMIKNVSDGLKASVEAAENVPDVMMEAIVEASMMENRDVSLADVRDNVVRAQMFLAVSSASQTAKIVDLETPEMPEPFFIPKLVNKAIAVRRNISVTELHQSFNEVKERLNKAAVAPHMVRLFHLLNEPNRLHLSPKCALLKDAFLTSSAPLSLYWKSYYAEKSPQIESGCPFPDPGKLKVKILKNAIENVKERNYTAGYLIKMLKKWGNVLRNSHQDQQARCIPHCKWTSLNGFSQSIIEEISCRHPLRKVRGLLNDVIKLVEQLNSVNCVGYTVDEFELTLYENSPDELAFKEIGTEIVDHARSVDIKMSVNHLSMKMDIVIQNLEQAIENSSNATVSEVVEEEKLREETRKRILDVATNIHPSITARQMQKCLSEIQNDLENVAVVPDQISVNSIYVEDPTFSEEMILHTKNEIINEAVNQNPDMSLGDLREAITETHKSMLSSKTCACPTTILKAPNNFVTKSIRGCMACLDESFGDVMELLEKIGRNMLSLNCIDLNRTVKEVQQKQLKEERELKEFNPFDIVYLANQYPPMRHALVANIIFKPLNPHSLRPCIPNLLKNNTIEMAPSETPIDFNGREETEFDFLDSIIQPYSFYRKNDYASRRSYEKSTKVLFYEK